MVDRRFCQCPGCGGCAGATRDQRSVHGNLFNYGGSGPINCPGCVAGKRVSQSAAAATNGRNTMTERPSEFFRSMGPGSNRRISMPELSAMQHQAEQLEARAVQADHLERLADQAAETERRAIMSVAEPFTYSAESPHSYFADAARVATGLGDRKGAERRLEQHRRELSVVYPAWREARNRQARLSYEAAFGNDRRGQELLERMDRLGLERFRTDATLERELRAASTTQGDGGYFAPPLWLAEQWAGAPRAGRPFANLWHGLPLPAGCSTINIPKWKTGIGSGPTTDGAAAPADSPADSYSTSPVFTIAGTQLVSMQFAEQNAPPGFDQFVFTDLMADIGNSLDVQLLIGSGTGQLTGIIPSGTAAAASLVLVANTNNASTQTLTTASAGSPVYQSGTRMLSLLTRARGLLPTHVVIHPSVYFMLAGTIDTTGRPLVPVTASPPQSGAMVSAFGMPALLDDNVPITFGGGTAPTVSVNGGGVSAVTDGNGTWTVIAAVRAPDLYLFEGEIRTRIAQDITEAGSGQWRFVAHQYTAALRDRYIAASTLSASGGSDSGSVTAGGATTCGVATHYESNSPLQPAANGF